MRKAVVVVALLLILGGGVVGFLINETRFEEEVVDVWGVTPNILYTHWNWYLNEFNRTYCRFIDRVTGRDHVFRRLFEEGKIPRLFLELNLTASDGPIRVRVGKAKPNPSSIFGVDLLEPIFDEKGTYITGRIAINVVNGTADANILEIINEEVNPVNLSGNTILKAEMPKLFRPFLGFGVFMCLLGFSLMFYGILAKPSRKRVLARI